MADRRKVSLLDCAIAASAAVVPVMIGVVALVSIVRPADPDAAWRQGRNNSYVSVRHVAALKTFERAIVKRASETTITVSGGATPRRHSGVPGRMGRRRRLDEAAAPLPSRRYARDRAGRGDRQSSERFRRRAASLQRARERARSGPRRPRHRALVRRGSRRAGNADRVEQCAREAVSPALRRPGGRLGGAAPRRFPHAGGAGLARLRRQRRPSPVGAPIRKCKSRHAT